MYCRDPKLLAAPTRRLKLYRRFANWGYPLAGLSSLILIGLIRMYPSLARPSPISGAPVLLIFCCIGISGLGGFWTWLAFSFGRMTCPCCDNSFTDTRPMFRPLVIPRECYICGYDVESGHRSGDF
jgi:hypothetical protein